MSFFELFQPGLRHLREERDRQKSLVANPTHGGGGPLGIDLSGGTARFVMPARTDTGEEETSADEDAEADASVAETAATAGDGPESVAGPATQDEDGPG